jgi:hypothetical protein
MSINLEGLKTLTKKKRTLSEEKLEARSSSIFSSNYAVLLNLNNCANGFHHPAQTGSEAPWQCSVCGFSVPFEMIKEMGIEEHVTKKQALQAPKSLAEMIASLKQLEIQGQMLPSAEEMDTMLTVLKALTPEGIDHMDYADKMGLPKNSAIYKILAAEDWTVLANQTAALGPVAEASKSATTKATKAILADRKAKFTTLAAKYKPK